MALAAIIASLAVVTSPRMKVTVPANGTAITKAELAYMRNIAAMSPGHAEIFVEQWPEYADYIMGK